MEPLQFIDTHCHLDAPEFDADRDEVIRRAHESGVTRLITIGSGFGVQSANRAVQIAENHANIFATIGLHPNDADLPFDAPEFLRLARHPKVVAVGETGLDFHWNNTPRELQEGLFRRHIEIAQTVRKPLVIHSRSAGPESLRILKETGAAQVGGVFHCYSEDELFAAELRGMDFLVSVPGNLTFKKADRLRTAIKAVPLSQIMLETDAPFLAPQAYRGKRCESCQMIETAKMLAQIKEITLAQVAVQTSLNAESLFRLTP